MSEEIDQSEVMETSIDPSILNDVTAAAAADSLLIKNESGLPDEQVHSAIAQQYPELISKADVAKLNDWVERTTGRGRPGGLFSQNKYVPPEAIFDQFKAAVAAARDDDIISNAVETTEQLAFKRVDIRSVSHSEEETDIWQQIKEDLNLEQKMRQIWRELFILSQCYVAVRWTRKDYRPRVLTQAGKRSKKVYSRVLAPSKIVILDPCKVIPITDGFGDEKLVYIADTAEAAGFDAALAGQRADSAVPEIITGRHQADLNELGQYTEITGGSAMGLMNNLFTLNPANVWRITQTKSDYQLFSDVRLLSVFPWLDLKHNLQESDRADILGNLNAIILVKKGSDQVPANQQELAQAAAQVQTSARLPIIVSDHRLEIEIITRSGDHALKAERYNAIDSRLTARAFQILQTGNYAAGAATDNSQGLFKIVASTMESRRDNIVDALMTNVFDKVYERNDSLTGEPVMKLRRIALDFDPNFAQYILDLFSMDQISRTTAFSEADLDVDEEATYRKREMDQYSDVFSSPNENEIPSTGNPAIDGRLGGGNRNGGGLNRNSFRSNPARDNPEDNQPEE